METLETVDVDRADAASPADAARACACRQRSRPTRHRQPRRTMSIAARRIGNSRPQKPSAPPGTPIRWQDVLRCLPDDETRSHALDRFRSAGFSADEFGMPAIGRGAGRRRQAREAAADALARTEDWLESEHSRRTRDRDVIRTVRRRLEQELWP